MQVTIAVRTVRVMNNAKSRTTTRVTWEDAGESQEKKFKLILRVTEQMQCQIPR